MLDLIADIRKDYRMQSLTESDADADAMLQFGKWWKDAVQAEIEEVNAMTLATASSDGVPAARIVLLKGFDHQGFRFFTNYDSFKGRQLEENPRACLVLFWKELERQVRITGIVQKLPEEASTEYFNSRPEGSRIGAIISPQSQVIADRGWLEKQAAQFQDHAKQKLVRPSNWGGYLVRPITLEFWQGRSNRLHDRLQYTLQDNGTWKIERLAP